MSKDDFQCIFQFYFVLPQDVGLDGSVLVFGKATMSQFNCEENNIHTHIFFVI